MWITAVVDDGDGGDTSDDYPRDLIFVIPKEWITSGEILSLLLGRKKTKWRPMGSRQRMLWRSGFVRES